MNIIAVLDDFRLKFMDPLEADITRTLEVTCHKPGEGNHGSNFIGNTVVLMGIEATSQFTNPHSEEEVKLFREVAKQQFKTLKSQQKEYLSPRHSKTDGSQLAKQFMKDYFGSWFCGRTEFGVPLDELIWAFRNPHAHTFYPHYQQTMSNGKKISGAVDWAYKSQLVGITIAEIESQFDSWMSKLYEAKGNCFRICPQVLFVFLKRATREFVSRIGDNSELQTQFLENYKRLSGQYKFAVKQRCIGDYLLFWHE